MAERELREAIEQLTEQESSSAQERAALETRVEELEREASKLRAEVDELMTIISELNSDKAALKEQLATGVDSGPMKATGSSIVRRPSELDETARLQSEVQRLEADNAAQRSAIDQLRMRLMETEHALARQQSLPSGGGAGAAGADEAELPAAGAAPASDDASAAAAKLREDDPGAIFARMLAKGKGAATTS